MRPVKSLVAGIALVLLFAAARAAAPSWARKIPASANPDKPDAYPVKSLSWPGRNLDNRHTIRLKESEVSFTANVTAFRYRITETDDGHHCRRANVDCESAVVDNLLASTAGGPDYYAVLSLQYFSDDRSSACVLHIYPVNARPTEADIPCPDGIALRKK